MFKESTFTYKKINNSVITILNVLKEHPFLSENEIMINAFGYNRNTTSESNKKYADMLRRALSNGTVERVKANVRGSRAKYFYYLPEVNVSSEVKLFRAVKEEKKKQESKGRGSQLMKDDSHVQLVVTHILYDLNKCEIDGETLDFIIDELGFGDYIDTKVINAIDSAFNKEIIRLFDEFLAFKGKIPFDQLKPEIDNFLQHKGIKPKPVELTEEELIRIAEEHLGEPVKLKK
jgi:hypothetical protein